jgi:LacI family transcriptional regulator
MAITRDKVAKLAGVSAMTVSRVLHGNPNVSPDTRKRVLEATRKCKYLPHAAARAMRNGRFDRIALAVIQYNSRGETYRPTVYGYVNAAANTLAECGLGLLYEPFYLDVKDGMISPPKLFTETTVDGVLAIPVGGCVPKDVDRHLGNLHVPVVWVNRNVVEMSTGIVSDEAENIRILLRHLIELGHRRIGYLGLETPHYSSKIRHNTLLAELRAADLDTRWVIGSEGRACLFEAAEQMLNFDPLPTAVISYNHLAHNAILNTACRHGIRVPSQLSLCYFSSSWDAPWEHYRSTALILPEPEMARLGVERLLKKIHGKQTDPLAPPKPIVGKLQVGWTTAGPGEEWNPRAERCRHENAQCVNRSLLQSI